MASESPKSPALLVKFTNLTWFKAEVHTADSDELLYQVGYHLRKPQLRFHRAGEEEAFATATFHLTSRTIDLTLADKKKIELKSKKWYNLDYQYTSPASQGQTLTWKSKTRFKSFDFVLLNEQQLPVAKMVSVAGMSMKKVGSIEFADGFVDGDGAKDEIVVTSLALSYLALQNTMAAASA